MNIATTFLHEMGHDVDPISVESLGNGKKPMKEQMIKALITLRKVSAINAAKEVNTFFEGKFAIQRKRDKQKNVNRPTPPQKRYNPSQNLGTIIRLLRRCGVHENAITAIAEEIDAGNSYVTKEGDKLGILSGKAHITVENLMYEADYKKCNYCHEIQPIDEYPEPAKGSKNWPPYQDVCDTCVENREPGDKYFIGLDKALKTAGVEDRYSTNY